MARVVGQAGEPDRLIQQSRFMEPFTRRLLVDAGIGNGMRVLDVGTGAGDVSLLAAELSGRLARWSASRLTPSWPR